MQGKLCLDVLDFNSLRVLTYVDEHRPASDDTQLIKWLCSSERKGAAASCVHSLTFYLIEARPLSFCILLVKPDQRKSGLLLHQTLDSFTVDYDI